MRFTAIKISYFYLLAVFFLNGCSQVFVNDKSHHIQQTINDQLFSRFQNDAKVEVLYVNNKIVIIGYVQDDVIKQKIQDFTSSAFTYKIFNEVQVSKDFRTKIWRSANDIKIENEIMSEFWFMKGRLNVRSLDGRIYAMGIVSFSESGRFKSFISKQSNVKQVFLFFDLVEDRN
jgi:hypothetical protein